MTKGLISITFIKDFAIKTSGEVFICSKDMAQELVKKGFAEYTESKTNEVKELNETIKPKNKKK